LFLGAVALTLVQSASAAIWTTQTGAKVAGLPVDAQANITFVGDQVTVILDNYQVNPKEVKQAISGFSFNVIGLTGTTLTTDVNNSTATPITIAGDGTYTASTSFKLFQQPEWSATHNVNSIELLGLANGPDYIIIGPANTVDNKYDNANSSIKGNSPHNPFIKQTATFIFTVPGIQRDSKISGASFLFGTDNATQYWITAVPEPSTYLAGLSALGMLSLFGWRNRK
jgi:PEP-CTERM motif